MTAKAQQLTKKQKRARNDARTAWRAMTPAQRVELLTWVGRQVETCPLAATEDSVSYLRASISLL